MTHGNHTLCSGLLRGRDSRNLRVFLVTSSRNQEKTAGGMQKNGKHPGAQMSAVQIS